MEEQQIISKLQDLKQVKPRENWVIFAKSEILSHNFAKQKPVGSLAALSNIFSLAFQRKFAYALVALLFVGAGAFGIFKFAGQNNQSANLANQKPSADLVAIKSSVDAFKEKSKNLYQIQNSSPQKVLVAANEVKDAAKTLTSAIQKDPELAKNVALEINNNKTYLDISSGNSQSTDDLSGTLNDLYKTTVDSMFASYEKTTLTPDQQKELGTIKDKLSKDGNYLWALENILLLMNSGTGQ